ncbi:class I SAM-dependent methyltransferase [Pseudonocardiaceae bacterium YIM PH 21723]|nr:class I SAM-dependent methyltransferase [Pseudonocardiaceae bacterium YIM PH 21723]
MTDSELRPPSNERERLRATFGADAERYDRTRPGYPAELFADLRPTGRVLEIGCGTGQATSILVQLGCTVVAVELSSELAALTRRKLPEAEVVTAAFEDWPLPARRFDLVLAATSFHWIDPAVRMIKAADALRPGGRLAVISSRHILGGTVDFFHRVQECYERWDPATPPGLRLRPAAAHVPEFDASDRFVPAEFRRYEWEVAYTTAEYLDLLLTYSGHLALPAGARDGLLGDIAAVIDREYGGRIVKRYLTELAVATVSECSG